MAEVKQKQLSEGYINGRTILEGYDGVVVGNVGKVAYRMPDVDRKELAKYGWKEGAFGVYTYAAS